jgi:hypothetical protein
MRGIGQPPEAVVVVVTSEGCAVDPAVPDVSDTYGFEMLAK